ncbi:MAG: cytokinin dehydrogenase [Actinomycetota bacterium]|nr:cytokinin dehydrogenase [Actinomycetota bacterium]
MPPNTREQMPTPPPPLDGELRFDEVTRKRCADDFGHIVHKVPEGVLLPGSSDDVAMTIRWTAQRGRKFAPHGQRHSTFGRSQVPSGIAADMSTLRYIGAVEGDRVVVEAGAKWSDVLRATLAQGRTPPVLTEYLELSVGGTLTVGGVGGTTSAFGVQSDNVIDMEVVTGEGKKVTCSTSNNADLFDAVRAGLGQVGVIAKATLTLVAAPESVRRFLLVYPDLATMLRDERLLSGDNRFDAVQGAIVAAPSGGIAFRLDAAKNFNGEPPDDDVLLAGLSDDPAQRQPTTIEYFDYLNRFAPFEAALRANGQWFFPHPWLMAFIGDSQVEPVVNAELDALNPAMDLGQFGQVALSPIRRSAISSPLLRMPSDDLCYAFNLVRMPATSDANEVNRLVDANKATYGRLKAAGGTLYPVSAFPLSKGEWRDHFGSAFGQLDAAKQQYDPGEILTPGYEIF